MWSDRKLKHQPAERNDWAQNKEKPLGRASWPLKTTPTLLGELWWSEHNSQKTYKKLRLRRGGDRSISACIIACGFFSLSTFKSMIRHFCLLVMSQIQFPNSSLFCLWECIKKEKWYLIINGSITEEGVTKSSGWKMCASQIQVGKGRAAQTIINQDYKQKHAGLLLCKILKPRTDRRKSQVGFKEPHVSSLWYRRHLSGSW